MRSPLRVLVVEDLENDVLLLVRELEKGGYAPVHRRVETADEMRAALAGQEWDVVVSDFVMPGFNGLHALQVLQEAKRDIPFIVVSGRIGEDTATEAMRAGANDCIMKSNLKRLVPAIERELRDAEGRRERRKAESALRESEERYRLIVEMAQEGIATFDTGGIIVFVNRKMADMLGYTPAEMLGQRSLDFVVEGDHSDTLKRREQRRRGISNLYETRLRRKDGVIIWALATGVPMFDAEGKHVGNMGMFTDISERKQFEQALVAQQEDLRALAMELGLAEERERRRIATELHDSASQTLAYCLMRLSTLKKQASQPELSGHLKELEDTMRQLVMEIRTLTFELSPPILYDVGLEAALKELSRKMTKKYGVEFTIEDICRAEPPGSDLRVMLFQIVRELMTNIAKHARARKAVVRMAQADNVLRVTVEDDGVGFDTDILIGHKRSSGFGLFNIRERVRHLGGSLEAHSETGQGTQIILVVPLRVD